MQGHRSSTCFCCDLLVLALGCFGKCRGSRQGKSSKSSMHRNKGARRTPLYAMAQISKTKCALDAIPRDCTVCLQTSPHCLRWPAEPRPEQVHVLEIEKLGSGYFSQKGPKLAYSGPIHFFQCKSAMALRITEQVQGEADNLECMYCPQPAIRTCFKPALISIIGQKLLRHPPQVLLLLPQLSAEQDAAYLPKSSAPCVCSPPC